MQLYFATHNPNKLKEIQQIIPSNYKVMGLDDLGHHEEIAETGNTLEENSALKAQAIHRGYGVACFSDDSGLEVASLGNRPGVKSARFAGEQRNDNDNMNLLLENLQDKTSRKARFRTVITYIDESGEQHQFEGTVAGEITLEKRGNNGFGYDPLFLPDGFDRTFAELTDAEKNNISHRKRAFDKLMDFLS